MTTIQDATLDVPAGVDLRDWDTDEPSERGIDGVERMRLVRADIDECVRQLLRELVASQ